MRTVLDPCVLFLSVAIALFSSSIAPPARAQGSGMYDPKLYEGLEYRLIGPYRGGRVTAVAGVESQPYVYYMGATGGGVWKTVDGGMNWRPVADSTLGAGSIGAIGVAPSDPNVVYVGTGEACIRGNTSPGDGMYRSTDAGKTWAHIGLADGGQIGAVIVHPTNPDLVYVAVLGHAFGSNETRGIFRSRSSTGTRTAAASTSPSIRRTRGSSTPHSGRRAGIPGGWTAAVRGAGCSSPRMGATAGPRSAGTKAYPRGRWARSRWRSRP
jgi:hypothetical protein